MNSKRSLAALILLIFVCAPFSQAADSDTVILNTLGYTTGQSVLLTHMAIGTLADAFVAKTYRSGEAKEFVTTYITVTEGMKEQMKKLLDANALDSNDAQFIRHTVEVLDLVLKEGVAVKQFVTSGVDEDAKTYDKARKKALKEIKILLGMKE